MRNLSCLHDLDEYLYNKVGMAFGYAVRTTCHTCCIHMDNLKPRVGVGPEHTYGNYLEMNEDSTQNIRATNQQSIREHSRGIAMRSFHQCALAEVSGIGGATTICCACGWAAIGIKLYKLTASCHQSTIYAALM